MWDGCGARAPNRLGCRTGGLARPCGCVRRRMGGRGEARCCRRRGAVVWLIPAAVRCWQQVAPLGPGGASDMRQIVGLWAGSACVVGPWGCQRPDPTTVQFNPLNSKKDFAWVCQPCVHHIVVQWGPCEFQLICGGSYTKRLAKAASTERCGYICLCNCGLALNRPFVRCKRSG